jgi:hypothetical protein
MVFKKAFDLNKKILHIMVLLLFFGLILVTPATSFEVINNHHEQSKRITPVPNDDQIVLTTNNNLNLIENSNPLIIVDITGGRGINIEIKNVGYHDIANLSINVKTTNKSIRLLSPGFIMLPVINANESIKIKVELFGFRLGEPIGYNRIILDFKGPDIEDMQRIIVADIFGYFVFVKTIFHNDQGSHDGYILYAPEYSFYTYLISDQGRILHSWESKYLNCITAHLLENGNLLRSSYYSLNQKFLTGGVTGIVEMFDWNGSLLWEFVYSNDQYCLHHDIKPLPNGNVLMIAWEIKTYDESVESGRNPLTIPMGVLWPCYIIEVEPIYPDSGKIVWEWHVWDHLIQDFDPTKNNYGIIADHPELIDINYGALLGFVDCNHLNSLDYNEEFDQILISSHIQNEIWVIDHSTTTEEAAGHTGGRYGKGGDLLYRWGNPQAYHAGNESDQVFFGQHDARWINEGIPGGGNIIVFNNGFLRPGQSYSSVVEIVPPVDENGNYPHNPRQPFGPEDPIWVYSADNPIDFYASIQSGSQRLPNGNTLICDGPAGVFFEVTPDKKMVWKYVNLYTNAVDTRVDKIQYYPIDYSGINDFDMKKTSFIRLI